MNKKNSSSVSTRGVLNFILNGNYPITSFTFFPISAGESTT